MFKSNTILKIEALTNSKKLVWHEKKSILYKDSILYYSKLGNKKFLLRLKGKYMYFGVMDNKDIELSNWTWINFSEKSLWYLFEFIKKNIKK